MTSTAPSTERVQRRSRVGLAVAAVVVAVALGVGVFVVVGDTDDDEAEAVPTSSQIPKLIVDPPPEGFDVTEASDIDELLGERELDDLQVSLDVYGRAGSEDPSSDLGVMVLVHREDADFDAALRDARSALPEVDDGSRAYTDEPNQYLGGDRHTLTVVPVPAVAIVLLSAELDEGELLRIADGLTIGDTGQVHLGELPEGFTRIASLHDERSFAFMLLPAPVVGPGAIVAYDDGETAPLAVASMAGGENVLALARFLLGADAQPTTVRGHEGWASADGLRLVWQEVPGVVVAVGAYPPFDAELVRDTAERLVAADDETWQELVAAAEAADNRDGRFEFGPGTADVDDTGDDASPTTLGG